MLSLILQISFNFFNNRTKQIEQSNISQYSFLISFYRSMRINESFPTFFKYVFNVFPFHLNVNFNSLSILFFNIMIKQFKLFRIIDISIYSLKYAQIFSLYFRWEIVLYYRRYIMTLITKYSITRFENTLAHILLIYNINHKMI